jgi:sensor histidine kinase regulating citrate/malate metabolism
MPLPVRVAAILVVILAATVGLTTVLAANKFKQGLGEILDARYRLIVNDVVATIDTSLDLGVDIADMQSLQALLDRTIEADPALLYVEVLDSEGIVLLSSDSSNVGLPAPHSWLSATRNAREGAWLRSEGDAVVLGQPVVASFGAVVGTVALGYSRAFSEHRVDEVTQIFARIGGGAVIVFALALIPIVMVLLRPERRALAEAETRIAAAARGEASADVPGGDPMLVAACAGAVAAFAAIEHIRREAERLDEEGTDAR